MAGLPRLISGLPVFGNFGVTDEDVYAALGTATLSAFVLGGGYILPATLSTQEKFTTVALVVGTQLLIKHVLKSWRENS